MGDVVDIRPPTATVEFTAKELGFLFALLVMYGGKKGEAIQDKLMQAMGIENGDGGNFAA